MPDDISVNIPLDKIATLFDRRYRSQIPFAAAVALNTVAFKSMRDVKADLPNDFTLRGAWVKKGVRVEKADKKNLTAEVGHLDWYMQDQAEGGIRRKGTQAIPIGRLDNPKIKTSRDAIKPTKTKLPYPNKLKDIKYRSRRFKINAKDKRVRSREKVARFFLLGKIGIFERQYSKESGKSKLVKIYRFKPSVKISRRWTLDLTIQAVVAAGFEAAFIKAMEKAIRTAR